jgi:hypothetical protein
VIGCRALVHPGARRLRIVRGERVGGRGRPRNEVKEQVVQVIAEPADRGRVGALIDPVRLLELVDELQHLAAAPRRALTQPAAQIEQESFVVDEAAHAASSSST